MTTESNLHPHDDLAVYALDALEPHEHDAVEAHLETCATCRLELDAYRATLGRMSVPEEPPARVWEGISRQIRATEPAPVPALVVRLADRRRPPRWLLAAAAVVAVLGVGAAALTMGGGDSATVAEAAAAAARDPESNVVDLAQQARVVVTDGDDYVLFDDLAALPSDETYQLWRTDHGAPVSLGVLGDGGAGAARVDLPEDVASFALSREPAGGSVTPTDILATAQA